MPKFGNENLAEIKKELQKKDTTIKGLNAKIQGLQLAIAELSKMKEV
jgi:hypothetical protein